MKEKTQNKINLFIVFETFCSQTYSWRKRKFYVDVEDAADYTIMSDRGVAPVSHHTTGPLWSHCCIPSPSTIWGLARFILPFSDIILSQSFPQCKVPVYTDGSAICWLYFWEIRIFGRYALIWTIFEGIIMHNALWAVANTVQHIMSGYYIVTTATNTIVFMVYRLYVPHFPNYIAFIYAKIQLL